MSLPYSKNKIKDSFEIEFDYFSVERKDPKELFLLLHGFSQRGESLLKKLLPILPKDAAILSPNAPFPAPFKTDSGYLEAYAWYFYLAKENKFVIPPGPAIKALKNLITKLGYEKLPLTIIGFSQGGYLENGSGVIAVVAPLIGGTDWKGWIGTKIDALADMSRWVMLEARETNIAPARIMEFFGL